MDKALAMALVGTERWAMRREVWSRLLWIAARADGSDREVREAAGVQASAVERIAPAVPGVAVIPIRGILTPYSCYWTRAGYGTSIEDLRDTFRRALADDTVKAIVFLVRSPGGDAIGVDELALEIFRARGQKPMISVVDGCAASGAYWLGSQADECVGIQSAADCGSIGCYTVYENWQAALDEWGVSIEIIRAGMNKAEGNPYEPLSPETRAHMQAQVDDIKARFVAAVARGMSRPGHALTAAAVRQTFGEGRSYLVPQAVDLGMLDRQTTLDDVIGRALSGRGRRRADEIGPSRRAEAEEDEAPAAVPPDAEGACPDGYDKGEDGMCYLHQEAPSDSETAAATAALALQAQADRDALSVVME